MVSVLQEVDGEWERPAKRRERTRKNEEWMKRVIVCPERALDEEENEDDEDDCEDPSGNFP